MENNTVKAKLCTVIYLIAAGLPGSRVVCCVQLVFLNLSSTGSSQLSDIDGKIVPSFQS